jgi:transposase-like protein
MGYSILIKESVLQKALSGRKTQHEIATEFGVGKSTIQNWLRHYRNNGDINLKPKEKRPKDWTPEERISALIETGAMTPEEFSAWCRKKGIFPHHLEQWKKDAISGISNIPEKQMREKETLYKKEISSLKRDLTRKEKALAETAALLVLKKKAQAIWGEPEED